MICLHAKFKSNFLAQGPHRIRLYIYTFIYVYIYAFILNNTTRIMYMYKRSLIKSIFVLYLLVVRSDYGFVVCTRERVSRGKIKFVHADSMIVVDNISSNRILFHTRVLSDWCIAVDRRFNELVVDVESYVRGVRSLVNRLYGVYSIVGAFFSHRFRPAANEREHATLKMYS